MIRWLRFSVFLSVTTLGWAAGQHELIPGLPYFRIADFAKDSADVQTALSNDSVVLDLRFAVGSADAAAAFALQLDKPRPNPHGVRLILINPSSSAAIIEAVSRPRPHQLTIGPRTPALSPDIAVAASVEEDRRAYDALTSGTSLEKLISSNPEKKRFDEAALAKSRANAAAAEHDDDTDSPEVGAVARPVAEKDTPPPPPPTPHDLVLERAAQVYRALVAAKR